MREKDTTLWCVLKFQNVQERWDQRGPRVKSEKMTPLTKTRTIAAMLPDKTKAVNYLKFAAALLTSDGPLRECNHREIRFF